MMQPNSQHVHLPAPRVFQYSLDWRFLLPISDPAKIYIAFEEETDLRGTLDQIGIPDTNRLSFSSFERGERHDVYSVVFPIGLPLRWVSAQEREQIELYRSIRQIICPGGYFLLGFENAWNSRSNGQSQYHLSTPRRAAYQLDRAGFHSIKIFGAMPNLRIPEYIFELNHQAMDFALQHRFRRKFVLLSMLRILTRTIGWTRISNFFPCYFAVATA